MLSTLKPDFFGKGAIEVTEALPDEGAVRRLAIHSGQLVTQPIKGIETTCDVLDYAVRTHGDRNAMGYRDIVKVHEEEKEVTKTVDGKEVKEMKKWKFFEKSDYKYISYVQLGEAVTEVSQALYELDIAADAVFNIYASTSVNWQLIALSCARISVTIATAYDTLGESGLTHSLNEPECVGIFTNADLLNTLLKVIPNTPSVRIVIYDGTAKPALVDSIRSVRPELTVLHIDELRERGRSSSTDPTTLTSRRPTPSTTACIMYTSGSTGAPKGVCLTHSNLVASLGSVFHVFGHHFVPGFTYLAYLPLAHVLEYIVELCAIFHGVTNGYANPRTLTDASVRNCKGDMGAFKPHIMFGVPAVWESVRKGILAKVESGGAFKKAVFEGAMGLKRAHVPILGGLADSLVLAKVREATGGNLKIAMNGGAAIGRETQEWISTALVPVLQGYGMTESCGMCTLVPPELVRPGIVGVPVPSIEIKLTDIPEAGYLSSNDPPEGEICIRGPSVTKGYFKRPDLNEDKNIFMEGGWFRTGDVGRWNADGTLSLIDRIKNLIKLQNGEYIALEHLESIYKSCNLVLNICVHASENATQPLAIIIPHEHNLRQALSADPQYSQSSSSSSAAAPKDLHALCADPYVQKLVLKQCNEVGKRNGLRAPTEMLWAAILTAEEWTPESGLVTPAQKVQRSKIGKVFKEEIEKAYGKK